MTPEYRDFAGDTTPRRHGGYGGVTYTDTTGRNDFIAAKVARDDRFVYFYVRTAADISPHTDPNWMLLFINMQAGSAVDKPHWEEYQFVVNRSVIDGRSTTLERSLGGWRWEPVGPISYRVEHNQLHLAIPREMLGAGRGPLSFQFKWSDNMQAVGDAMDFYQHGDTAPDGRLNYVYSEFPVSPIAGT